VKRLTLIAAAVAAALVPVSAAADKPTPPPPLAFAPIVDGTWNVFPSVEQQPDGVVNPNTTPPATHCLWDVDDWTKFADNAGQLAGNATVGYDECLYADAKHLIGINIQAPTPDLEVKVTFVSAPETRTFKVTRTGPEPTTGLYRWRACISTPGIQQAGPLPQPIPGSNGGMAVATTIQFRVTNLSTVAIVPSRHDYGVSGFTKVRNWGWQNFHQELCNAPYWPIDLTNYPQIGTDPNYRLGTGMVSS